MSPRKVLYLLTSLGLGGTERNAAEFCRHIDRSRFVPEVWYLHDKERSLRRQIEAAGVEVRRLGAPRRRSLSFLVRTARRIARSQADLIHVFLPTVGYYASLSKLLFRNPIPMLFSAGGTHTELPFQRQMYKYGIGRYCYPILCNSLSVRRFMRRMGIRDNRLRVIPNGHDLNLFSPPIDRVALRREFNLDTQVPLLVTVGRLTESKRHQDLFLAQKILADEGRELQSVVIGEGPLQHELVRQVRELGIAGRVLFAGRREDVPRMLRMSDCFVFPSQTEGLPNAVIEASLAGLPIVACDVNGVVDAVRHQESALLTEPRNPTLLAQSIRTILDQPELAARLARNARARAESTYDIRMVMRQIEQAYDEAMAGLEASSEC